MFHHCFVLFYLFCFFFFITCNLLLNYFVNLSPTLGFMCTFVDTILWQECEKFLFSLFLPVVLKRIWCKKPFQFATTENKTKQFYAYSSNAIILCFHSVCGYFQKHVKWQHLLCICICSLVRLNLFHFSVLLILFRSLSLSFLKVIVSNGCAQKYSAFYFRLKMFIFFGSFCFGFFFSNFQEFGLISTGLRVLKATTTPIPKSHVCKRKT